MRLLTSRRDKTDTTDIHGSGLFLFFPDINTEGIALPFDICNDTA